jgi:hypothetical protein
MSAALLAVPLLLDVLVVVDEMPLIMAVDFLSEDQNY